MCLISNLKRIKKEQFIYMHVKHFKLSTTTPTATACLLRVWMTCEKVGCKKKKKNSGKKENKIKKNKKNVEKKITGKKDLEFFFSYGKLFN